VQAMLSEADCIVIDCGILNVFKRVCVQIGSGAHSACYPVLTVFFFFLEVKAMGHRDEHIPPSSTKVANEGRRTSTLPVCLHGIHRDNLTGPNYE
jgi:hypothetical protein